MTWFVSYSQFCEGRFRRVVQEMSTCSASNLLRVIIFPVMHSPDAGEFMDQNGRMVLLRSALMDAARRCSSAVPWIWTWILCFSPILAKNKYRPCPHRYAPNTSNHSFLTFATSQWRMQYETCHCVNWGGGASLCCYNYDPSLAVIMWMLH